MRTVRIHEFGGPDVLKLEELKTPEPGPGEVLIEVRAASVNPVDYKIREGRYPPVTADQLPVTLGRDVAGLVKATGGGVTEFAPGDDVFVMLTPDRGGYAEWVTAPASVCARKPVSLGMIQAASVPLAALTAWQALFTHGGLRAERRVLVHGASGGVGSFAVQLARARGAQVYATCSADNLAYAEGLGAARAIDYRSERFEDVVHDLDLVIDLIGGETEARSWQVLRPGGRLISTVQQPDDSRAEQAGVTAARFTCQPDGAQLAEIARLIDDGQVSVRVDQVYALEEAAEAERHLEDEHVTGKVVLDLARN